MNPFANLHTLVSTDRLCNIIKYSQLCQPLGGYMATFGVYMGGSLEVIAKFNPTNDVFGIDSFAGVPRESEHDHHREGDFSDGVNYHAIAGYFKMLYNNVRIVRGFSPDVWKYFDENVRFSFVEIDVDMYQSVLDGLDFFLPRMLTGGMILCDDFKVRSTPGSEIAVKEFFDKTEIEVAYRGELKYWDAENAKSHHQYLIIR